MYRWTNYSARARPMMFKEPESARLIKFSLLPHRVHRNLIGLILPPIIIRSGCFTARLDSTINPHKQINTKAFVRKISFCTSDNFLVESKEEINQLKKKITKIIENPNSLKESNSLSEIFRSYCEILETVVEKIDEEGNEMVRNEILNYAWEISDTADMFLQEWYAKMNENGDFKLQSDYIHSILQMWARLLLAYNKLHSLDKNVQPRKGIPQRATHHLDMMGKFAMKQRIMETTPFINSYNLVLDMWSSSNEHMFTWRADSIMKKIDLPRKDSKLSLGRDCFTEEFKVHPNAKSYRTMIKNWSRIALDGMNSKRHVGIASFNAQNYLLRMLRMLEDGFTEFEPTLDDYLCVFRSWAKAGKANESGKRSYALLHKMEYLHRINVTSIKPNMECYKNVLCAASESKGNYIHGKNSEKILSAMETNGMVPDSDCYRYAILSWSNATRQIGISKKNIFEVASKANEVLDCMAEMYFRSSVLIQSTTADYNNVIRAWSMSSSHEAIQRAEKLVRLMEYNYQNGNENAIPTRETYFLLIKAWEKSTNTQEKVSGALNAVARMKKCYEDGIDLCQPNTNPFNAVISVCGSMDFSSSSDDEKQNALKSAIKILKMMKQSDDTKPNSATYFKLLNAFDVLLKGKRMDFEKAIESVFVQCCKEGLVDQMVIQTFHKLAPYEMYRRVVLAPASPYSLQNESSYFSTYDTLILPHEWTTSTPKHKNLLTVDGRLVHPVNSCSINDYKMRKLNMRRNQSLLQGGRI